MIDRDGYAIVNHGEFLDRLETSLKPNQMENVATAYIFAKEGHRGQTRNDGRRYFDHLKSVAWIIIDELDVMDAQSIVEALLHDIVEDRWLLTPHRIRINFGRPAADGVKMLTRRDTLYYPRLLMKGTWRELLVKGCDRLQNLRTMGIWSLDKQGDYVQETRTYIIPLVEALMSNAPARIRRQVPKLRHMLEEQCQDLERSPVC